MCDSAYSPDPDRRRNRRRDRRGARRERLTSPRSAGARDALPGQAAFRARGGGRLTARDRRAGRRLIVGPRDRLRRGRVRRSRRRAPRLRDLRCRRPRRRLPGGARAGRRGRRTRDLLLLALAAVAGRRARPAACAGADLARRRRATRRRSIRRPTTAAPAASCIRRTGPRSSRRPRRRGARYVSFADYLLLRLTGELRHERLDGERHRCLRPEPPRLGRRDA